jgi:hypothetical protein
MALWDRWRRRVGLAIEPDLTDEATGWVGWGGFGRADAAAADGQQGYRDALAAWRTNPYAKRAIDIITDYTVGDGLTPVAPGELGRFIDTFWTHPQNRLDLRLPELVDELSRSGDLFLALFRNSADGMSYVRAVPKSEVVAIETAENDWEREIAYVIGNGALPSDELRMTNEESAAVRSSFGTTYLSPAHPDAESADVVMLHYSINRPVGALLGESELATILPWLRFYGAMLEDRVRLNWAARAFLWFVKVPPGRVAAKAEQYAIPPEPGSIVIHDDGEQWEMKAPALGGTDAQHDLRALRQMIAAGTGQPPHWHGDGGDINRAVAQAMQDPAIRRLRRRQKHVQHIVVDLCDVAYGRAYGAGLARRRPDRSAIRVDLPDISREDNESLALAAQRLSGAFTELLRGLPGYSPTLVGQMVPLIFKFAGEPMSPGLGGLILDELGEGRIRN